jgi:hypothetical protein
MFKTSPRQLKATAVKPAQKYTLPTVFWQRSAMRNFGDTQISQNEKNQTTIGNIPVYVFVVQHRGIVMQKRPVGQQTQNRPTSNRYQYQPQKPATRRCGNHYRYRFWSVVADVKVTIGTQVITIATVSATEIKFTLPADITAGDLALVIKNSLAAISKDPQGAHHYTLNPPRFAVTVLSISPAQAKAGDVVTVLGTGFSATLADNVFKFNGATAVVQSVLLGQHEGCSTSRCHNRAGYFKCKRCRRCHRATIYP